MGRFRSAVGADGRERDALEHAGGAGAGHLAVGQALAGRGQVAGAGAGLSPWGVVWRVAFWVSAWLVLPTYGFFYCRSVDGFVSPMVWAQAVGEVFRPHWVWAVVGAMVLGTLMSIWPRLAIPAALLLPLFVLGSLGWFWQKHTPGWVAGWLTLLNHPWTWCGALLVAAPTIWCFSGRRLSERLVKLGQLLLVVGVVFGMCLGAYYAWDDMHRQAVAKGIRWEPMWMPRYLGLIWPAVGLAMAALLMRLPTRPVRWLAMLLFVAVNLAQYGARLYLDPEPPIGRIAADVVEAQRTGSTLRTYVQPTASGFGAPGEGTLVNPTGKYYLATLTGRAPLPIQFRGTAAVPFYQIREYAGPQQVVKELQPASRTDRLIVWERAYFAPVPPEDPLLALLGSSWKRAGEQVFQTRVFWNWQDFRTFRRREYVRR